MACVPLLLLSAIAMARPLEVFVSVAPLKTFVEQIGGDHVAVHTMVEPGYSPATYDPSPQQIAALSRAALYVRTGVPFELAWMERIRAANPDMRILDARIGIDLLSLPRHTHDAAPNDRTAQDREQAHGAGVHAEDAHDPHVWTSPPLVKHMAGNIHDLLAELDPRHAPDFARNRDAFLEVLDHLDRTIRELLEPLSNRRFMVFHPAWSYFAATYGLTQVPIEAEGKEPGARTLAALIEQARRDAIRVVFVQPQFDDRLAVQVARFINGRILVADPLAADYVDNLLRVAQQFAEAMQS
ncbi:MAG: zinc ABC transporter substrate-binding protein [Chromatiaceae bacterium]